LLRREIRDDGLEPAVGRVLSTAKNWTDETIVQHRNLLRWLVTRQNAATWSVPWGQNWTKELISSSSDGGVVKNQGKTQSMPGGPVRCLRLRNLPRHDVRSMCEQDRRPQARERQVDNLGRRSLVRLPGTAIHTCVLGTHMVASGRCGQRGASPYATVSDLAARGSRY